MIDFKREAIATWTDAPCGPPIDTAQPGSKPYFVELLRGRREYAPWMADALDYEGARGLEVLDVGCGQGIDLYEFASHGGSVTGIDLTPRHVELANSHLARMLGLEDRAIVGDAEAMPFASESFHRVSSNGVLHHTPNILEAFKECYRVLRPRGEFRVILYNQWSLHYWLTQVLGHGIAQGRFFSLGSMTAVMSTTVEAGSRMGHRPLVQVYSRRAARRMLATAGFREIRTFQRHFRPGDIPFTSRVPIPPQVCDALGRLGGWYIVATAVRP